MNRLMCMELRWCPVDCHCTKLTNAWANSGYICLIIICVEYLAAASSVCAPDNLMRGQQNDVTKRNHVHSAKSTSLPRTWTACQIKPPVRSALLGYIKNRLHQLDWQKRNLQQVY